MSDPEDQYLIPAVIEQTARGERVYDLFSLLLKERIVFLGTPIDPMTANTIIAQLLYLEREDHEKDIRLYIHSPGGMLDSGLAIYDTMQLVRCDISTVALGSCHSMATVLLAAGTKGKRYALSHSTIHLHQPMGTMQGQAEDMRIAAQEVLRQRQNLYKIIARHTGQPLEKIQEDCDRDLFLDPKAAKEYGLIDEILDKKA